MRRFQSEPAAGGYSYKRKLKQPGTYEVVYTLHEEMAMKIKSAGVAESVRGLA